MPFPPGGSMDLNARALVSRDEKRRKGPLVMECRPGAGGGIAGAYVAKALAGDLHLA
jgi:tripartite-type tricarboxylate transporter receptor subunit TctC